MQALNKLITAPSEMTYRSFIFVVAVLHQSGRKVASLPDGRGALTMLSRVGPTDLIVSGFWFCRERMVLWIISFVQTQIRAYLGSARSRPR